MRVILLKDVRTVGRKDEIKDVADGFAANFLLPKNLAVVASAKEVAALEKTRAEREAEQSRQNAALDEIIHSLSKSDISLSVRATPKGGLFKAITAGDIVRAIQDQKKIAVPAEAVVLDAPIKTTGEHRAALKSKNASAALLVRIVAEGLI